MRNMKKAIFAICVIAALTSCGSSTTQNDSATDSMTVVKADTTTGIKIDSMKVKSVKTDSAKKVK